MASKKKREIKEGGLQDILECECDGGKGRESVSERER